MKPTFN